VVSERHRFESDFDGKFSGIRVIRGFNGHKDSGLAELRNSQI
jgi:hypothetical protein